MARNFVGFFLLFVISTRTEQLRNTVLIVLISRERKEREEGGKWRQIAAKRNDRTKF